jgi:hypothetical protein
MSDNIEYNYMSVSKGGKVLAIFAMEKGCENEQAIVNAAIEKGLKLEKVTEEEYSSFGEEIIITES